MVVSFLFRYGLAVCATDVIVARAKYVNQRPSSAKASKFAASLPKESVSIAKRIQIVNDTLDSSW